MEDTKNQQNQNNAGDPERTSTTINKQNFLDCLEQTLGTTRGICLHTKISRATYYNWMKDDREFRSKVRLMRKEVVNDIDETLVKEALKGDIGAMKFVLVHKHPAYRKKQKIKKESIVNIHHHSTPREEGKTMYLEDMMDNPILSAKFFAEHPDKNPKDSYIIYPNETWIYNKVPPDYEEQFKRDHEPVKMERIPAEGSQSSIVPIAEVKPQMQEPSEPMFSKNLSHGSKGEDVKLLQQLLNMDPDTQVASRGMCSPGFERTDFGNKTQRAVERFQRKYNIHLADGSPYGIVDDDTRTKLEELYRHEIEKKSGKSV